MKKSRILAGAVVAAIGLTAFTLLNTKETQPCEPASCVEVSSVKTTCGEASASTASCATAEAVNTCNVAKVSHESNTCQSVALTAPPVDIHIGVNSWFANQLSREHIAKATRLIELLPDHGALNYSSFSNVTLYATARGVNKSAKSEGAELTQDQMELLSSLTYNDMIEVEANYVERDAEGNLHEGYFLYPISITPHQVAEYNDGQEELIASLIHGCLDQRTSIEKNKLMGGQIVFGVTSTGAVSNVRLISSSGYDHLDNKMLELTKSFSGNWTPAEDATGQNVEQELVVSFGAMGC